MRTINCPASVGVALLVLGLAACGQEAAGPSGPDARADAAAVEVAVEGFRFGPPRLEVAAGTTVVWRNSDGIGHTATSGEPGTADGTFDVDTPGAGTSGEHTFTDPGRFPYFCRVHASMTGEVVVTG